MQGTFLHLRKLAAAARLLHLRFLHVVRLRARLHAGERERALAGGATGGRSAEARARKSQRLIQGPCHRRHTCRNKG